MGLLSEDDFAASADVLSSLVGALVGTSLEADDGLAGVQLLFSELAFVLVGGLGSKVGSFPFWVFVRLPAEGEDGVGDLGDVFLLPQVDGLEDVDVVDSVGLEGGLEAEKLILLMFGNTSSYFHSMNTLFWTHSSFKEENRGAD